MIEWNRNYITGNIDSLNNGHWSDVFDDKKPSDQQQSTSVCLLHCHVNKVKLERKTNSY